MLLERNTNNSFWLRDKQNELVKFISRIGRQLSGLRLTHPKIYHQEPHGRKEKTDSRKMSSEFHVCCVIHMHVHTHKT